MAPKRALSISDCGCSMRRPIENGLASRWTPRRAASRRCRARCGRARARRARRGLDRSPRGCAALTTVRPRTAAVLDRAGRRRAGRSGPRRRAPRSRRASSRPRRPGGRCRCAACRRRGSPRARRRATNSSSTLRVRWRGSLIWLHSLPSEKVPAPPSPNCTFDSGSRMPRRHRPQVSGCARAPPCRARGRSGGGPSAPAAARRRCRRGRSRPRPAARPAARPRSLPARRPTRPVASCRVPARRGGRRRRRSSSAASSLDLAVDRVDQQTIAVLRRAS